MSRVAGFVFVLLVSVFGLGCGDGAGVQYLPIGQRCNNNSDCGTSPFQCLSSGYPGGYCSADCKNDSDCPKDAGCVATLCKRRCSDDSQCRSVDEDYFCASTALVDFGYCEPRPPATP